MRRRTLIFLLMLVGSVIEGGAIPRGDGKRELQRLVRMPRIEFPSPLSFDRLSGFVICPNENAAADEVVELVKELKGTPADAAKFLEGARILARGGDMAASIRYYGRAADLFGRSAELEPGSAAGWIGLAEACLGLGRFGEAQAALDKGSAVAPKQCELAAARLSAEKAWFAFVGEENRFSSAGLVDLLAQSKRPDGAMRMEIAKRELARATEHFSRAAENLGSDAPFLRSRAAFYSLKAAMEEAFAQVQSGERSIRNLRRSIYAPEALEDLQRIVELSAEEPEAVAVMTFAATLAESGDWTPQLWAQLGAEGRENVWDGCRKLQEIASGGSKRAAKAAELLGCAQVFLMGDCGGGQRSFRAALRHEPLRERSWDLLVFAIATGGDPSDLTEACEERSILLPNARSSALLIKSYDRQGDTMRAEVNALLASGLYPQDLYVNLSLAAVLLKRTDFEVGLGRAGEALSRAEKQLRVAGSRASHLDFVLLKSLYLGLSGQSDQAKALLKPYGEPELAEVLRALEF